MPVVEKVSGPRVHVRGIGHFSRGDRADVSEADARYLTDERGDFVLLEDGDDEAEDGDQDENADAESDSDAAAEAETDADQDEYADQDEASADAVALPHESDPVGSGGVTEPEAETGTDAESDSDADAGPDVPAPDAVREAHWQTVVAAIEGGAYDDALDTVAEADDRASVLGAVADRRDELEG